MPDTGLLSPASVCRIAAELGLRLIKQRSQNFVIDANTVRRIVSLSGVGPDDVVLKIGPGLGSLTLGLLEVASEVSVIEIDERLAGRLGTTVVQRLGRDAATRLNVMAADAMTVTELPGRPPIAVVANLPYNVSVPMLMHLLESLSSWQRGLVMVQLEVADRFATQPGLKVYGAPSTKLAWRASTKRVGTMPPRVLWPVPNVDSGLVRLERRDPPVTTATRERTFAVINAAFTSRRKMLRAALSGIFGSSAAASEAIESAGIDPRARGEALDVTDFAAIANRQQIG